MAGTGQAVYRSNINPMQKVAYRPFRPNELPIKYPVSVRVASVFTNAYGISVRVSGVWVAASDIYVRVSGAWVKLQ